MTKLLHSFVVLFSVAVLLQLRLAGQIGVVPNGDIRLKAATDPKYRVGDVWEYETRRGEEHSTFIVVKVESSLNVGLILHIGVDNLIWKSCPGRRVPQYIPHMPFGREAIDASAVRRIATTRELPSYREGYEDWRQAFLRGRAGIYSIRIKEAVSVTEEAWRAGMGCAHAPQLSLSACHVHNNPWSFIHSSSR